MTDARAAHAFTVSDAGYFLGTVAMVNSLRLTGHDVAVTVLDLGLTPAQRGALEAHCDVVTVPDAERQPLLAKASAPLRSSAEVMMLLDSDVLVTAPLTHAFAAARAGRVFAYPDNLVDRRRPEWAALFDLRAPLRDQPAVNSGFVVLSRRHHGWLLERYLECCRRLRGRRFLGESGPDDPAWLGDQDALNALLMSEVGADEVEVGPRGGMAIGPDALVATSLADRDALECWRAGERVHLLHAIGSPKPWQPRVRWEYRPTVFDRALRRVLSGAGLAIRVRAGDLPVWLRSGAGATLGRAALRAYEMPTRWTRPVRERLGVSPWRWRVDR